MPNSAFAAVTAAKPPPRNCAIKFVTSPHNALWPDLLFAKRKQCILVLLTTLSALRQPYHRSPVSMPFFPAYASSAPAAPFWRSLFLRFVVFNCARFYPT